MKHRLRYETSGANPKCRNVETSYRVHHGVPSRSLDILIHAQRVLGARHTVIHVSSRFTLPTNSHANCREFGSRVRSRKGNSIGARGRRPIACTLYIGDAPPPRHFLPSRVVLSVPGFVTLSSGEFSNRPPGCSFRLRSRQGQKNEPYIFHGPFPGMR